MKKAVEQINEAVDNRDEPKLMAVMTSPEASLSSVKPENSSWYMQNLVDEKALKAEVCLFSFCLLYTSPSPRDGLLSRMPSSA